jgi:hypothetical protein
VPTNELRTVLFWLFVVGLTASSIGTFLPSGISPGGNGSIGGGSVPLKEGNSFDFIQNFCFGKY